MKISLAVIVLAHFTANTASGANFVRLNAINKLDDGPESEVEDLHNLILSRCRLINGFVRELSTRVIILFHKRAINTAYS